MICQILVERCRSCGAKLCQRCGRCHTVDCDLQVVCCRYQYKSRESIIVKRERRLATRGAQRRLRRHKWHAA